MLYPRYYSGILVLLLLMSGSFFSLSFYVPFSLSLILPRGLRSVFVSRCFWFLHGIPAVLPRTARKKAGCAQDISTLRVPVWAIRDSRPFFSFSRGAGLWRAARSGAGGGGGGGGEEAAEATVEFSRGTQAANEPPRYINAREYNTLNTFATLSRIDDFIDHGGRSAGILIIIIITSPPRCSSAMRHCELYVIATFARFLLLTLLQLLIFHRVLVYDRCRIWQYITLF